MFRSHSFKISWALLCTPCKIEIIPKQTRSKIVGKIQFLMSIYSMKLLCLTMEANGKTGDDRDRVPSYQRNVNKQTDDSRENDRIQSFSERRRKKRNDDTLTHSLKRIHTFMVCEPNANQCKQENWIRKSSANTMLPNANARLGLGRRAYKSFI